ncbi:class I SAM-dependent methyltransferase [Amycolatopsis vastitatis]|uniref:Methyltransferase domain-containing protein n=1 Tax=Amycolatopsis vastitatis TaxID=1905142 RepID=A0A229TEQ1_9PSEU|nr:class I SAM-dependent methyltransferase [Amycolatopsis vastitatis]OXM69613.1 hypothetical protein CF165_08880 [Amycolatopsis vastitatis]
MQPKPYAGFEDLTTEPETSNVDAYADPITGDAYGELIRDAYESDFAHHSIYHVYEFDDGMVNVRNVRYMFRPPVEWRPGDLWALERASGECLDIGMGAGRVCLALQERGLQATGFDRSAGAVKVAYERGVHQAHVGEVADMENKFRPASFDTIFMLGLGLGLLGSPEMAPRILRTLHNITAPGGSILGEGSSPVAPDNPRNIAYLEKNRARGWMPGQNIHRLRYRQWATPWTPLFFAEPDVLARLIEPHGWLMGEVFNVDSLSYVAEIHRLDNLP